MENSDEKQGSSPKPRSVRELLRGGTATKVLERLQKEQQAMTGEDDDGQQIVLRREVGSLQRYLEKKRLLARQVIRVNPKHIRFDNYAAPELFELQAKAKDLYCRCSKEIDARRGSPRYPVSERIVARQAAQNEGDDVRHDDDVRDESSDVRLSSPFPSWWPF